MSTPTTKPHGLARAVVSDPDRIQEWAAWELLYAVNELFPERFEDLRVIGEDFQSDLELDPESVGCTPDDLTHPIPPDELFYRASNWADKNNIGCLAVYDVATRFAWGLGPTLVMPYSDCFSWLAIHARPESETRSEFVKRAEKHYDDMTAILLRIKAGGGFRKGPIKRDRSHFLYLAANRVGRYTWEQLENGETPLGLPSRGSFSIANEAQEIARLIGLPLKRGRPRRKP